MVPRWAPVLWYPVSGGTSRGLQKKRVSAGQLSQVLKSRLKVLLADRVSVGLPSSPALSRPAACSPQAWN